MSGVIVYDDPLATSPRERFELSCAVLPTLAEIVANAFPEASDSALDQLRVTLVLRDQSWPVARPNWHRVRPRTGTFVVLRMTPADPVSLFINLVGFIQPILYGLGVPLAAVYPLGYVGATALVLGATYALGQSLVPVVPELENRGSPEELFQLEGWQNQLSPDAAFPFPIGKIRMSPLFLMPPYPEIIDGEQHITGLFTWGIGRLQIEDLKLGETPVSEVANIVVETREGTASDAPHSLAIEQVFNDNVNLRLTNPVGDGDGGLSYFYRSWTSPPDTDRIRVILLWPVGLHRISSKGKIRNQGSRITFEQRRLGSSEPWQEAGVLEEARGTIHPFYRQFEWRTPEPGQWIVRMYRSVRNDEGMNRRHDVTWVSAAAIVERSPLSTDIPMATTSVRIKANDANNGVLNALNGVVTRYAPVWTGSAWEDQPTRNAASAAMAALRHQGLSVPENAVARRDAQMADWFDFCAAKGLTCNAVLAGEQTFGEVMTQICGAGRASWHRDGEGWGVVIDRPQPAIIDEISPRNAGQLKWSRRYAELPDAFRVTFRDETSGYAAAERIVPFPGLTGDPEMFEALPMFGKTDPAEVWIEARRRQYELIHRPDTFIATQTGEIRHATRGDAVGFSCDILDEAQIAAKVRRAEGRFVELDAPVKMVEGEAYAMRWQVYDEDDTVGYALQATVQTRAGEGFAVLLAEGEPLPPEGQAVRFGRLSRLSYPCRITRLEPAQGGTYRLTLQNDAPIIDTLTDAEVPPEWVRVSGADVISYSAPTAPVLGTPEVGVEDYDFTATAGLAITLPVTMPPSNLVSIARIEVFHGQVTSEDPGVQPAASYAQADIMGGTGTLQLPYPSGARVAIYARAVSVHDDVSPDTNLINVTVDGTAAELPLPLDASSLSSTGGLGHVSITVATRADTAEVQLFRAPSGTPLDVEVHALGDPRPVPASSTVTLLEGDATSSELITAGDMSDAAAWDLSEVTISEGAAQHATGAAGAMAQDLVLSEGQTYRGAIGISGLTAGTLQIRLGGTSPVDGPLLDASAGDGLHLFEITANADSTSIEIIWSADCPAFVTTIALFAPTATSAEAGTWDFYIAPITSEQVANVPTGPTVSTIV
ncbi:hypothetical protein J4E08_10120 [Sagittula sp. NFXS13]|uniref:TipJ family phage tail tip protein n=1 Tax=Sagittula sp. NFXS13 TaxID=2819095 RepID=UPI0032DF326A